MSYDAGVLLEALKKNKAAQKLSQMIQKKTVWFLDENKTDFKEFEDFIKLTKELFPLVTKNSELEIVNGYGMLFKIKGEDPSLAPAVLMSHYDVVSAEESQWAKPPFSGIIEDGEIWGRGSLDTKCTLAGIMEAAELLLEKGFKPKRDIYVFSTNNEEPAGPTCPKTVQLFAERGIKPYMVLDEGGIVANRILPFVKRNIALIGVTEKGILNVELTAEGQGGHSAAPQKKTSIIKLAEALLAINKKPFRARMIAPVAEMLYTLGSNSPAPLKLVLKNQWLFKPLIMKFLSISGETNAFIRTTTAATMAEGSNLINVMPKHAKAWLSIRLMPGDTSDEVVKRLSKITKKYDVTVKAIYSIEASPISQTDCESYKLVKDTILAVFKDCAVSQYIMPAATDSRHFCNITPNVYRFSPLIMTKEELASIHKENERIPVQTLDKCVEFFLNIINAL
jgi:carboxypeptidase PM20D1